MSECKKCYHYNVCDEEIGYGRAECPEFISTEDVVPRSEVEELQKKLDEYKKFVGEIRVTSENHAVIMDTEHTEYIDKRVAEGFKKMAVHKAKQDVAREIFEEIERCMLDGEIAGKYPAKVMHPDKYAELKKKYIGE